MYPDLIRCIVSLDIPINSHLPVEHQLVMRHWKGALTGTAVFLRRESTVVLGRGRL